MRTPARSFVVITILLSWAARVQAAAPELRGTWLTTTANEAISSPANTAATMEKLREIGLNTVYVEVWKNGYTEFPSQTMKNATGVELRVNASPAGPAVDRDLLSETLMHAHRNGLIYIAWFEYGFMVASKDTDNQLRARKDWLSLDKAGNEVAKNGFVWLNPIHPDAQNLLLGIVKEAIKKYDLDGIQLDDRIVWPYIDMGYDDFTKQAYAAENDGQMPPDDPKEPKWVAWRQKKVEEFSKRFVREIRAAGGPDLIISLSPGPHPWAMENYLIDWPSWSQWKDNPTWDEYIPQVYRMNYARFETDWKEQVGYMGQRNKDLIAGIRLVGDGPDCATDEVTRHADLARATGSMGHCWWYSKGVLDTFPDVLAAYYDVKKNGPAPHPAKGADWRPMPIVARNEGGGRWTVDIKKPGTYTVIWKIGGVWGIAKTRDFRGGPQDLFTVLNARPTAVELIPVRRKVSN